MGEWSVEIVEVETPLGNQLPCERYTGQVDVSSMESSEAFKAACETCRQFGKNLACPPFSPLFNEWLAGATFATVLYIRLPVDSNYTADPGDQGFETFRLAKALLFKELSVFRQKGFQVAGAGYCMSCDTCAAGKGHSTCFKPDARIFSLESMGVNVTALIDKAFGFSLDWDGQGTIGKMVGAVGCIFHSSQRP